MAAKGKGKPATPKRFKQARADARPAAKAAFSGNKKAGLKDPTVKLTADDKKAISEMQKAGAADKKAGLTQADTEARAAERQRAIDRFRQGDPTASSTAAKTTPAPAPKPVPSAPRLQGTSQAAASKPVVRGITSAVMPRRFHKLAGEILTPKQIADQEAWVAQHKAATKNAPSINSKKTPGQVSKEVTADTKPQTKKPSTTRTATRGASSVSKPGKSLAIRPDAVISPNTGKEVAIRGKGTVATTSTQGGAPAVREAKVTVIPRAEASNPPKFTKARKVGKGLLGTAVAAEVGSMLKGSTDKDLKELDRLKAKLAQAQGKTYKPGFFGNLKADTAGELSQLGNLATMGLIGKTRRQYMDELNTKIAKAGPKKQLRVVKATAGGMTGGGTAKAQAGVQGSTGVKKPTVGRYVQGGMPGGGIAKAKDESGVARPGVYKDSSSSKTKGGIVAPGGIYTVVPGDNLDAIAQRHGVSLKKILEENPVFTTNPKYKGGNMIWAGSKVRIPGK